MPVRNVKTFLQRTWEYQPHQYSTYATHFKKQEMFDDNINAVGFYSIVMTSMEWNNTAETVSNCGISPSDETHISE